MTISQFPVLTAAERERAVVGYNQTVRQLPEELQVHRLFEQQAAETPEAPAVCCRGESLTYRQLDELSNRLAHHLLHFGAGPERLAGICLDRASFDLVVGILAVLKCGAAYLPIDPDYPRDRIEWMIRDSGLSIVLTHERYLSRIPDTGLTTICMDSEREIIGRQDSGRLACSISPDNLAYVIYTSGSTGKPKGTMLAHRGLANLARAHRREFGVDAGCRMLQFAPLSFDASVWEIFLTLLGGGCLYLVGRDVPTGGPALLHFMRDHGITHVLLPPSMLQLLTDIGLPDLRTLISGGEICPPELARRWSAGRRFINAYGPTEATVIASCHPFNGKSEGTSLPIGRPTDNTQLYVLDEQLNPVPPGVPGELHIGGVGLARGYLNRPDLTARCFIPNPFGCPGSLLYKTGDLARCGPDGNIQVLGRVDQQVKLRGFRIELGEIESLLKQHPAVLQAAVIVRDYPSGDKRLASYVVPRTKPEPAWEDLRAFLRHLLPDYMIPSTCTVLDALPVTPSGKIDFRALPDPGPARSDTRVDFVAPRTEAESRLAAIWEQELGIEKVGIHDNFFDLGGHSLLAVRIHGRIEQKFNRTISMVELFRYPTVSSLARFLSGDAVPDSAVQDGQARALMQKNAVERQQMVRAGLRRHSTAADQLAN